MAQSPRNQRHWLLGRTAGILIVVVIPAVAFVLLHAYLGHL